MKQPRPTRAPDSPRWLPFAVAALVAAFIALAVSSMLSDSQTSDEAIHLAAGYAHLTRADFALNPEHPPLAKEIAALPLLLLGVSLPVEDPSWRAAHEGVFQLPLGERFLHHNGVPFTTLLAAGRTPIVLLGAALCLTVFVLSRRLFGWRAGLTSLGLCALCPNVLAHARLITTDLAVSLFLLVTMWRLHRYHAAPSPFNLALTGLAAGLTLASKFSAVALVPALAVVFVVLGRGLRPLAAILAIALATLAATYAVVHVPTYFSGLAGVFATVTGGSEAFLLGRYSDTGWWYYYPVAMLLKTPVPALILFATIPFCYRRRAKAGAWRDHVVVLAPLALFGAASLAAARNVGVRHVLPLYPLLFVLAGQAAGLVGRRWRAALAALAVWYAGSALWVHPSYLAYVNELGGGPSRGWKLLSDSNIDWGQDLFRLRRLMESEGVEEILLGHYGNQDPAHYGITYQYLPGAGHIKPAPAHLIGSERTLLAVSVMTLQGMFMRDKSLYRWLQGREPLARVGYSIFVYDLTGDREAYQRLADLYARSRLPAHAEWSRRRLAPAGGPAAAENGPDTRREIGHNIFPPLKS